MLRFAYVMTLLVVGADDARFPALTPDHELVTNVGSLRGYDHGEFGGGLWWCPRGGKCEAIAPPRDEHGATLSPNVLGIERLAHDQVLVTGGLAHLLIDEGWATVFSGDPPRWKREDVLLDGEPRRVCREAESVVIATTGSVYRAEPGKPITREVLGSLRLRLGWHSGARTCRDTR
jgi:hypothetical protein